MRRFLVACSVTVGMALSTGAVMAGDWHDFWERCHVDFHRNNAWPEPFLSADRAAQRQPFCIMTDNGWKMQNTVGTYLFDPNTQELNQAGELLVKWIVTQAPQHRRAVFVLKGDAPEHTTTRMESVQAVVAKYAGGTMPPVMITDTEPPGWSAAYIDAMQTQFQRTVPTPRLPAVNGGGGAGGAGGGGGAPPSN